MSDSCDELLINRWATTMFANAREEIMHMLLNERQRTLFACACVSRVVRSDLEQTVIGIMEDFADDNLLPLNRQNKISPAKYHEFYQWEQLSFFSPVRRAICHLLHHNHQLAIEGAVVASRPSNGGFLLAQNVALSDGEQDKIEQIYQSHILTAISGIDLKWDKRWNNCTVAALASKIYNEKSWSDCPILADALEDAGCQGKVLDILRTNMYYGQYRGNWIIDKARGLL